MHLTRIHRKMYCTRALLLPLYPASGSTLCTVAAPPEASCSTWIEREPDPWRAGRWKSEKQACTCAQQCRCSCSASSVISNAALCVPATCTAPTAGTACSSLSLHAQAKLAYLFPR